jgi:uncharacterized protein (TIGR02679 family)
VIRDRSRLEATLGHPDFAWLVKRLRDRVEAGRPLTGTASLASPSVAQKDAVDRLLGRPPSGGRTLRVALPALNARLREAGICDDLEDVARAYGKPLVDRRAAADRVARCWEEMSRLVTDHASLHSWINFDRWWERLRAEGLLLRLADGELEQVHDLLHSTLRVLSGLPVRGMPLPELAAATLGDSHALDSGQPVSTLVLRALAEMTGTAAVPQAVAGGMDASTRVHRGAPARHELWARVGVDVDALAGSVLALNLPAIDQGLTGWSLARHTAVGEPVRLTGRQLLTHPPDLAPVQSRPVYICENPAVVAAAAHRLGPRCAPILCTEGQPRVPLRLLVSQIVAAGGRLLVRADFDWGGVGIVNGLLERYGNSARPWRMGRADYLALPAGPPLRTDRRRETPWEPVLASAMVSRGVAVHEESLLPELLIDLDAHSGAGVSL